MSIIGFVDQLHPISNADRIARHDAFTTFSSILEKYNRVLEQYSNLGIAINPNSRILRYRKTIADAAGTPKRKELSQLTSLEKHSIYEAYKFIDCFDNLKNINFLKLKPVDFFTKLANGTADPVHKASDRDDESRNYFFEFEIASRFYGRGSNFSICEEDYVDVNPEISLNPESGYEKIQLLVECKRVTTQGKVLTRIKTANKQINKSLPKLNSKVLGYGFICVDITQILNPDMEFYIAPDDAAYSNYAQKAEDELEKFFLSFENDIQQLMAKNPKLFGVLFTCDTLAAKSHFEVPTGICSRQWMRKNLNNDWEVFIYDQIANSMRARDVQI